MSALDQLLAYDFEADQEFDRGLQSILTRTDMDQSQKEQLVMKAKLFFFAKRVMKKTGLTVTMEEYLESQRNQVPDISDEGQGAVKELSFAEIKHLIESGKADLIPNNKTIPDRLNDAPASAPVAQPRRKPWESASETSESKTQA